jgi:hypothetical protein
VGQYSQRFERLRTVLTSLPRLRSERICNLISTTEVDAKDWVAFACFQDARDIEIGLPELILGGGHILTAELNARECIQTIEYQP